MALPTRDTVNVTGEEAVMTSSSGLGHRHAFLANLNHIIEERTLLDVLKPMKDAFRHNHDIAL